MKYYYNSIIETIGKTPLVKLNRITENIKPNIFVKLESFNPGGSVKDRIALSMILKAEEEGIIEKDTTIVEPTSGNTGIGLALICAVKGYKLILIMPDSVTVERKQILQAYGTEVILTPKEGGMKGSITKAEEISKIEEAADNLLISRAEKEPFRLFMKVLRMKGRQYDSTEVLVPISPKTLNHIKKIADHSRSIVIPAISKI